MRYKGILALLLVAAAAIAVVGSRERYARWIERSASTRPQAKITLQFFKEPKAVPAVTMQTLDGQTISSADWRGKVVIVNFWATWCSPCRAEVPDLVALQEKYRDRLQIVGISDDEEGPEVVRRFAAQYHINYPLVMNTAELRQAFPGIRALPTSFVINRDAQIVQKHVGMLSATRTEQETRMLAGLTPNATIEYVEDENETLIKNAAQATSIPGLELDKLPPAAKRVALQRLNSDKCTCGCELTLAACRINDPSCGVSLPLAKRIADAARADGGHAASAP